MIYIPSTVYKTTVNALIAPTMYGHSFKKSINNLDYFVNFQVASILKKSSEEKNNGKANSDINGRIEYFDQALRSVDSRMRAVEKRLSIKSFEPDHINISQDKSRNIDDAISNELLDKLDTLDEKLKNLEKITQETKENEIVPIRTQLSMIEGRTLKLENQNKITIGKIKVPIEFSGLAATIVMFATGYLIYNDHWNIIRSPYYPIAIGILFGSVVIGKFIITNRK